MADDIGEGGRNFLTHKLGPFPMIVWIGGIGVVYLVLKRRGAGAGGSSGPGAGSATRDPAGNVGAIDPATGYVYGSQQDTSALGAQSSTGSGGSTSGSGGSTIAGQYADNAAWSRAAINFLVGVGVDPTVANSAVTNFLSSQTLSTDQQAAVNLAVQSIGAPPTPPTPGNSPNPVVTPPSPGTVYASNPPTGVTVTDKSPTSMTVTWNRAANASAYTVSWSTGSAGEQSMTVSGTAGSATLTGLTPDTLYQIKVQGTPAKAGDPSGTTSATTSAGTSGGGSTVSDPHAGMRLQPPQVATLVHGRSLTDYARGNYPVDTQQHLNTLIALNPTLGPNDTTHPTMQIRTSDARWVPA